MLQRSCSLCTDGHAQRDGFDHLCAAAVTAYRDKPREASAEEKQAALYNTACCLGRMGDSQVLQRLQLWWLHPRQDRHNLWISQHVCTQ